MRLGIVGCGDFLRWQESSLKASSRMQVAAVVDPDAARATRWSERFGCRVAASAEALIADPAIDAVALFMPPWLRTDPLLAALRAGKHVIATKPLASTPEDARKLRDAARSAKAKVGVIYSRTGDAFVRTAKQVLDGGTLGRLALYQREWMHHYPQWNAWALDPVRNGGPFMDAMIHNLNAARYLMGRPVESARLESDRLVQDIPCPDTESMTVRFAGGMARLFITWAAELATWSKEGNDREHLDHLWLITDQGWYIVPASKDGRQYLHARKRGEERWIPAVASPGTPYDCFAAHAAGEAPWPEELATAADACEDLLLVRGLQPERAAAAG